MTSTYAHRMAAQIGREFPSGEASDRRYARQVARYLLGVREDQPAGVYDEVVIDTVKAMLRRHGYRPASDGARPWRSPL